LSAIAFAFPSLHPSPARSAAAWSPLTPAIFNKARRKMPSFGGIFVVETFYERRLIARATLA